MICGEFTGFFALKDCRGCGTEPFPIHYHCDLRTCPRCSKRRKNRIFARYLPFFRLYKVTKADFFQFLTISPKNYKSLEAGFTHIKKSFSKFLRRKYVKERIKAGFYVLETKQAENGSWNIHIHAILYGRWLDYRLRGRCLDCGQNLLRFNKFDGNLYCAKRSCNSTNVICRDDTKLGREWAESAGSLARIYGIRVNHAHGAVSYLTKYTAANKDNFTSAESVAEYIYHTRKKKLINSFGLFFEDIQKGKMPKPTPICRICNEPISFSFDLEVSEIIWKSIYKPPPTQQTIFLF